MKKVVTFMDSKGTTFTIHLEQSAFVNLKKYGVTKFLLLNVEDSCMVYKKQRMIRKLSGPPYSWVWRSGNEEGSDNIESGYKDREEREAVASACLRKIRRTRSISNRTDLSHLLGR